METLYDDEDDPDIVDVGRLLKVEKGEWRNEIEKTSLSDDYDMGSFIFKTSYDNDYFIDQFDDF